MARPCLNWSVSLIQQSPVAFPSLLLSQADPVLNELHGSNHLPLVRKRSEASHITTCAPTFYMSTMKNCYLVYLHTSFRISSRLVLVPKLHVLNSFRHGVCYYKSFWRRLKSHIKYGMFGSTLVHDYVSIGGYNVTTNSHGQWSGQIGQIYPFSCHLNHVILKKSDPSKPPPW